MIQEPIQPTAAPPRGPSRTPRGNALWIGLVIVACFVLAVPVVIAMAGPQRDGSSAAVGASAAPTAPAASPKSDEDRGKAKGLGRGWDNFNIGNNGNHGNKGFGSPGRGPITIRSIDGSALSLGTDDGWTRTITVTSSTVITKGGQPITVGSLKVGDEIRFSQTRNADGTYTINAIMVPTPVAGGEVTAVDATTITVKGKGGTSRVITVDGSTVYTFGSAPGTKADVKVGVRVDAQGTVSGDTFTAITVRVQPAEIGGEVTAKTSDSITIKNRDGSTTIIHVTAKTIFEYKGKDAATLRDVAVGDRVSAEGRLRGDGSLDAVSVEGRGPKAPKPPKAPAASAVPG